MTIAALLARLEEANEGHRELDVAVAKLLHPSIERRMIPGPFTNSESEAWFIGKTQVRIEAYTTSLDAALTLVPEGWQCILYTENRCAEMYDATLKRRQGIKSRADAATLPLALCIAALKARSRHGQ